MRRTISGWFLGITGFLVCPCHLVITLPLAAALLSGTALGGWITTHQGAIVVGASVYFIGALAAGGTLLLAGPRGWCGRAVARLFGLHRRAGHGRRWGADGRRQRAHRGWRQTSRAGLHPGDAEWHAVPSRRPARPRGDPVLHGGHLWHLRAGEPRPRPGADLLSGARCPGGGH